MMYEDDGQMDYGVEGMYGEEEEDPYYNEAYG